MASAAPPAPSIGSYETTASGVSWGAVIGGAFVAAAMSLILLSVGTGLGLSSISPWSGAGAPEEAIAVGAVVWLIVAQVLAFGLGGYVAGRLRIKWATVHSDEVYFRDTAHGLLVWAVAAVVTAALLTSAATSMAGGRPSAAARGESGETSGASGDPTVNAVDMMFRTTRPERADVALRAEVNRVLHGAIRQRQLATNDQAYLDSLIVSRTGVSPGDADRRVTQGFAELQQTIDLARRRAAKLSLWLFVALLAGAFCASYAATIGGRQRDHVIHLS